MNTPPIYRSQAGYEKIMALYDSVLGLWPVPYEEIRVPTRIGETFMIASGHSSAPPLFLFHGSCSNAVTWVGNIKEYSQFFRVYAVDIPGEPGRSSANRPDWNTPAYSEWMDDVLNGLNIEKAALLGISQGGWLALKYATFKPEKVNKLVLVAPGGVVPARLSFILRAAFLTMLGKPGAKALNNFIFGKEPASPEAYSFMMAIMTHFKPRMGKMDMFTDDELGKLKMPVLLVGGLLDAVLDNRKIADRLETLLPQLTTKLLQDKGHVLVNTPGLIIPFLKSAK